jgi:hypothetical protein
MEKIQSAEKVRYRTRWTLRKFANDMAYKRGEAYEEKVIDGNILLNAGINQLWTILCSSGGTKFDASNAYLGVGDSSTAEAATQTDLQAATNKLRKAMDASYPTYGTSQKATWKATFGGTDANFAWNEFGVFNASTGGTMLNRKVSAQGTKTSGQTWELTLDITLS